VLRSAGDNEQQGNKLYEADQHIQCRATTRNFFLPNEQYVDPNLTANLLQHIGI